MTLEEKKALVADFLARCNVYADGKLADYASRLTGAGDADALVLQDKITHWTAYRAFNSHTIAELESDRLDSWFEESSPP